MDEYEHRRLAWDMIFSAIAGFQYHPGNPVENRMPPVESARLADELLAERDKRWLSGRLA